MPILTTSIQTGVQTLFLPVRVTWCSPDRPSPLLPLSTVKPVLELYVLSLKDTRHMFTGYIVDPFQVWMADVNQGLVPFNAVPQGGKLIPYTFVSSGRLTKFQRPGFGNTRVYTSRQNSVLGFGPPGNPPTPPPPGTTSTTTQTSTSSSKSSSSLRSVHYLSRS